MIAVKIGARFGYFNVVLGGGAPGQLGNELEIVAQHGILWHLGRHLLQPLQLSGSCSHHLGVSCKKSSHLGMGGKKYFGKQFLKYSCCLRMIQIQNQWWAHM